jgi:hypothetical protein
MRRREFFAGLGSAVACISGECFSKNATKRSRTQPREARSGFLQRSGPRARGGLASTIERS